MPYYYRLKNDIRKQLKRNLVIDNLLRLKRQLDADIPDKDMENNLLLATWNIRDFGKRTRLRESHFYIAEILSRFDLIAVQEVNQLDDFQYVMNILGPDWDYIATDVADREAGGNGERMAFVYDKRKVSFKNIAGEIVLPQSKLISQTTYEIDGKTVTEGKQFRRTPFVVSFQSGWFKFDLCTVHIYYGAAYGKALKTRIEEIDEIAGYLGKRADKEMDDYKSLILLGDFNIVHPEHKTMKALTGNGFTIPKKLRRPTNIDRTKFYDQIAFKTQQNVLDYVEKSSRNPKNQNAGVFEMFDSVFREEDLPQYLPDLMKTKTGKKKSPLEMPDYYDKWKTYQMSDHKPLWVRLQINNSEAYLEGLKKKQK